MPQTRDITGEKYHKLTAIKRVENINGRVTWEFRCDCGNTIYLNKDRVLAGNDHSCGCQKRKQCGSLNYIHGKTDTPLYEIWKSMKQRCCNQNVSNYHNYGGRGIKVCDEWMRDFKAFYDWAITNGWKKGLSIDRINNDGDYSPSNCKWSTRTEQLNNTRQNKLLSYKGKIQTISQWAREIGMKEETLRTRLNLGWDVEKALTTPIRKHKEYSPRKVSE